MGRCQQKVVASKWATVVCTAIPTSRCSHRFTRPIAADAVGTASCGTVNVSIRPRSCERRALSCMGSVLDVEMTILDKQSKGIPIDEQPNDNVVHLARF